MAIDVYLQIDGIKGESQDDKHQGWIECQSVRWVSCNRNPRRHRLEGAIPLNALN